MRIISKVIAIFACTAEVRSHALRALTNVIYDRRSLKVLTIYDPRYTENASTVYDLRSLPFLTFRDLRSMTFNFTIDDHSPFVRFTIYGSRCTIHVCHQRSTIVAPSKNKQSILHVYKQLNDRIELVKMRKNEFLPYFYYFHACNVFWS